MLHHSDPSASSQGWQLDNSFTALPESFYIRTRPVPVTQPALVRFNESLADQLGLNARELDSPTGAALFAGNQLPADSDPISQAYAGHQFGHFTILGDGRAVLLGEQLTPRGERFDIQLKGSGETPFSRRGDGRAALGPMLREYLISEAMHGLGIPTTRSLAVVTTGEPVYRERELRGAILTRVAASHLRVGTFEYAAAHQDPPLLQALVDYTLHRHFPEQTDTENPALSLLQLVLEQQASLIAQWQSVGFIHGVMNTDNMALSGETIDYGPCAFMDRYDPGTVFSSIDRGGRYAYGNQPKIAHWNLAKLAETLLPVIDSDPDQAVSKAREALQPFPDSYHAHWLKLMRTKLGLGAARPEDEQLITTLLEWMQKAGKDFTQTFRLLTQSDLGRLPAFEDEGFQEWNGKWQDRLKLEETEESDILDRLQRHNPIYIPRNHRIELALETATQRNDYHEIDRLLEVFADPFRKLEGYDDLTEPAPEGGARYQTFCGT